MFALHDDLPLGLCCPPLLFILPHPTLQGSLWKAKGQYMGDEIRAFNNLRWYRATGDSPHSLIGLNGYGPNLNIARDPYDCARYRLEL